MSASDSKPLGLSASQDTSGSGRLPTNVKPTHYDLTLAPNLDTFKFHGSVTIFLKVLEDSRSITLHSVGLDLQKPKLKSKDDNIAVENITYNETTQTATFHLGNVLPADRDAELSVEYSGVLGDDPVGIYRAKYGQHNGSDKYILISQMEAVECRRTFPCFDEPALKATFATTMVAHKDLTCLTNMNVDSVKNESDNQKAWVFKPTPPMSTYLMAFAVGEFKVIENNTFHVPIKVYAPPNEAIDNARFAAQTCADTLKFFEKQFGVKYPLPKMDFVAAPHYLGAMENWGLVLYEDRYIIFDEKTADKFHKQMCVSIVQHELAHQWFGNIVTMEFWDGLWLNESFATWAALYAGDSFYPDWKLWQVNLANEYDKAFRLDSLRSSHQIEVPVKDANDINQIFDDISYAKGSCVLRMIASYVGEDVFIQGVANYLKKHAYQNTFTDDLWDALADASGKDVKRFGDGWARQVGHPILTVTEDSDSIHIKQNRFFRTGDVQASEDTVIYPIPLALRTPNGVDDGLTLDQRECTIKKTDDFFKINADHAGFYRTMYQPDRLKKLVAARNQLPPEDRFSLVTDAEALAAGGYQKTSQALWLFDQLGEDTEYIVWKGIITAIKAIRSAWIFEDEDTQRFFNLWEPRLISKKAHELGWTLHESDGHVLAQYKALMFDAAVRSGDKKATDAAVDMFAKYRAGDQSAVNPNIRLTVFVAALATSEDEADTFNFLRTLHRESTSSSERRDAITALGNARQPELVQEMLRMLLTEETTSLEIHYPMEEMAHSPESLRAALDWLIENIDAIEKRLTGVTSQMGWLFGDIIAKLSTDEALKRVQGFFETRSTAKYNNLLTQSYDEARVKIAWVNRDRNDVKQWLQQQGL